MKKAIITGLLSGTILGIGSTALSVGATILFKSTKNPLAKGLVVIGTGISAFCMGWGVSDVASTIEEDLEYREFRNTVEENLDEFSEENT